MEQELLISGYCRNTDESRMVMAEIVGTSLLEVDCCYESCPHTPNCTIAQRIRETLKENER